MSGHKTLQGFALCILAYSIAAVAAWICWYYFKDSHPMWMIGIADVAATIVIFTFSLIFKNSSFYDPYWSIIPVPIAFYLFFNPVNPDVDFYRQLIALILVNFWAIRLTFNWARQWKGLSHEDWRYIDLRNKTGKMYWIVNFLGIHLYPTVMVYLACLPLFFAMSTESSPFNWLDVLATFVTFMAVVIEWASDEQLRGFAKSNPDPKDFMKSGLWAYSRHPNYFGEASFWTGLFLFGLASNPASWWTGAGALSILTLFVFVTVPMMDNRNLSKRPGYATHMKKVSGLVPWFPKK